MKIFFSYVYSDHGFVVSLKKKHCKEKSRHATRLLCDSYVNRSFIGREERRGRERGIGEAEPGSLGIRVAEEETESGRERERKKRRETGREKEKKRKTGGGQAHPLKENMAYVYRRCS